MSTILFMIKAMVLTLSLSPAAMATQTKPIAMSQSQLEKLFQNELSRLKEHEKSLLAQADAYLQRTEGFYKMKDSPSTQEKIGILCLQAKAGALLAKGAGSICRTGGDNPQFLTLGALGGGIALQWTAGATIGVIETTQKNFTGKFEILSIGFSPGLGAEMLFAKSEHAKLFMIGAGVGLGVELTGGHMYLLPLLTEKPQ